VDVERLLRRGPAARAGQAVYSQNRDGYEVQGCGRGEGGSELWLQGCCVGASLF